MDIVKEVQRVGRPMRSSNTLERRIMKTMEEVGELSEAFLSYTSAKNPKEKGAQDILEEAVDVAIMGLDIALTQLEFDSGVTEEYYRKVVYEVFRAKLAKWEQQVAKDNTLISTKPTG